MCWICNEWSKNLTQNPVVSVLDKLSTEEDSFNYINRSNIGTSGNWQNYPNRILIQNQARIDSDSDIDYSDTLTQEEIDNASVVQDGAKPGDLRFVDQNKDGKISFSDDSDQTELGSAIPTFTFGYNLNASYKGFDVSANLYSAIGQEIIRNYERQQPFANQLTYNIDRWTGAGSTNENPRLTTDLNRNTTFSDFYVENGSFLRLKNLQLGYTLPKAMLGKLKIQSTRIYVAANNLITLTNYQGFDPDLGSFGGALAAGIDYGFYPQARTIMTGLSIKF